MFIIAGLGNPGSKYAGTRHNTGFRTLDILAERYKIDLRENKFQGLCGSGYIDGQKVLLLKPLTFMNLSGQAVREAVNFYKVDPAEDFAVIYDDISLEPGKIRVRGKGSAGGHNGIKNIIAQLGTDQFKRVKVGVGAKPEGWDLADYVLGHFPPDDEVKVIDGMERASRAAAALVTEDLAKVMNDYN